MFYGIPPPMMMEYASMPAPVLTRLSRFFYRISPFLSSQGYARWFSSYYYRPTTLTCSALEVSESLLNSFSSNLYVTFFSLITSMVSIRCHLLVISFRVYLIPDLPLCGTLRNLDATEAFSPVWRLISTRPYFGFPTCTNSLPFSFQSIHGYNYWWNDQFFLS